MRQTGRLTPRTAAVAVVTTFLIFAARVWLFGPVLGADAPLMFFYVAVMVSAWAGGLGAGLLAAGLSALAAAYFLLPPHDSFAVAAPGDRVKLTLFVVISGLLSGLAESMHRSRRRLEREMAERKRSTDALRASEERYRLLSDALPHMTWVMRPDRTFTYVNRQYAEFVGRPLDRLNTEGGWERLIHPDDLPGMLAAIAGPLERGEPHEADFRLRRHDGEYRWVHARAVPVRDAAGAVVEWVGTNTDVHDRRIAGQALRESEERFRLVVEGATEHAIIVLGPDGRVTSWNSAAERIFGYRAADMIGRPIDGLFTPEDAAAGKPASELREAAAAGRANDDKWLIRADGTRFYASGATSALRDDASRVRGFVKILRDHTERLRLRDELQQRVKELAEADRRKDEFLAMLAHELRNPLAPIRNALEILRLAGANGPCPLGPREVMERQVRHLVRLVDDLLDASRITRGKIELRREPVELRDVVNRAVELARPAVEAGHHELTVTLPAEPVPLTADPVRLAQVFGNLLHNAAKYTPPGGRIELSAEPDDGHVLVRVRDTGVGIPADLLNKVFDLFTQADRTPDRSQGGLGIGLFLVRKLVEMHGGVVEAKSDGPGKGSEFVVRLPVADGAAVPPRADRNGTTRGEPAGLRVLVVDDNVDAAETLTAICRLLGHEVRTVYDGLRAVEAAEAFRPDVVILDIGLPGLDGYQVARVLRERPQFAKTVLVAVTGYGRLDDQRRALESGFDQHMTKPADPNALHALLDLVHPAAHS